MPGNGQEQFRDESLLLLQADPREKAALPQALFDGGGGSDQPFRIRLRKADVDHHPVLDRVAGEDPAGIGQDGVILRQGGNEIGIEGKAVQPGKKQPRHRYNDEKDERPPQSVPPQKHEARHP